MSTNRYPIRWWVAWTAMIVVWAGCSGSPEISTLKVTQTGWDTMHVALRFENRNLLGRGSRAVPGSVMFTVFSATYDTLYVGQDSVITVPDRQLGNSEPILVEACGEFGGDLVCEQQTVFASPKRIWSGIDVDYPSDAEYTRGDYRARPLVERRVFAGEDWEALPDAPVPPMTAHVRVAGTAGEGISIPIRPSGGRFDLRSGDGYRDFSFNLRSAFRDSGRAEVVFQVVAGKEGRETPAGSARIALVDRSEEELLQELQGLVRRAGNRLVSLLGDVFGRGRTYVFIDGWNYDSQKRRYEADLVFWTARGNRGGWQEMTGRLDVSVGGESAVFRLREASFRVEQLWNDRVDADTLTLGPLGGLPRRFGSW